MLVLNLPFKALMFLTLMRPSLVLFLVLWLKLVKDFLKVRCRLALLPFLISCLIWLDLVASLPVIKERILGIILQLHFLSLILGSVLVLMLPLLVWLTPDLRIKKSLLKCNWTIRKRLPRCKMRLKKRLLAFSRRLHARIRKTRYMHKIRWLLINRRILLLALRLFFFQAEDGIRDVAVTGVQTCALPIFYRKLVCRSNLQGRRFRQPGTADLQTCVAVCFCAGGIYSTLVWKATSLLEPTLKLCAVVAAFLSLLLAEASVRLMAGEDPPKQVDQKLFQELRWRLIGPFRGGRVLAGAGVRGHAQTFYFGAVGGRGWETK